MYGMVHGTMIQGNSPGHWLPDVKRFVRPIDGFDAPDIADPLKPGERPQAFEIPTKPDFDRPIKPKVEHELLLALADPHASLIDIANEFEISLEALSTWLLRPDVAARMESIAGAAVVRARFVAKSFLPAAARSAGRILALHQIFRRHNPKSMARDDHNDRRFDKTAMQASAMLIQIARLDQPPARSNSKPNSKSANSPKSPEAPPGQVAPLASVHPR